MTRTATRNFSVNELLSEVMNVQCIGAFHHNTNSIARSSHNYVEHTYLPF
jgi:hypothetical protein